MIKEYISFSLKGVNLLPTIFLGIVIFYWLLTILGVISSDSLDIDFGLDDADLDINGDGDFDVSTTNLFVKVLAYGNFGLVPFMVYMSVIIIVLWALSMLTYYLKINPDSAAGIGIFFLDLIISFFVTKLVTHPLIPFFQGLEINKTFEPVGKSGILTTDLSPNRLGTLSLDAGTGSSILINVMCNEGSYEKGTILLVMEKLKDRDVYLVEYSKEIKNFI